MCGVFSFAGKSWAVKIVRFTVGVVSDPNTFNEAVDNGQSIRAKSLPTRRINHCQVTGMDYGGQSWPRFGYTGKIRVSEQGNGKRRS